jgi:hypothetical protein
MTHLAVPDWMNPSRVQPLEHWHAITMHGGLIASVVVSCAGGAAWTVRTQLRDRSLQPVGEGSTNGPFATEEAALRAGRAAAWRLHRAAVGMREIPPQAVAFAPPPSGWRSQALRRFAQAQRIVWPTPTPVTVQEQVSELIA